MAAAGELTPLLLEAGMVQSCGLRACAAVLLERCCPLPPAGACLGEDGPSGSCGVGPTPCPPTPAPHPHGGCNSGAAVCASLAPCTARTQGLSAADAAQHWCRPAAQRAAAAAAVAQQQQCGGVPGRGEEADSGAGLRHRALSFVRCVLRSRALQSALLSLELSGSHPPVDGSAGLHASGLEWTLAQLLALHLRAGLTEATGGDLLAMLWLLESLHSSERSKASACMASWLQYLPLVCTDLTLPLVLAWPGSQAKLASALSASQMRVLKRMDWRVRLDSSKDVWPCLQVLFDLGAQPKQPHSSSSSPAAASAPAPADLAGVGGSEAWPIAMHALCAGIRKLAWEAQHHSAAAAASSAMQPPATPAPAKRAAPASSEASSAAVPERLLKRCRVAA